MKNYIRRIGIYWTLWSTSAKYSLAEVLVSRGTSALFFIGKAIRFIMMLFFLLLIKNNVRQMAGYQTDQVIVFFLTYQLMDTIAQIFYRGVYLFSWQVRSGELDFYLAKPINPLFRILTGKPDLIDVFFIIPSTVLSLVILSRLHLQFSLPQVLLYFALFANGFLIATAFHILVICLGIITTEVDNAVMLYRDVVALSRFPLAIYGEGIRLALFLVIPVGLMNTLPTEVLLGVQPSVNIGVASLIGIGFFILSLRAWNWSLRQYTSAGG